jgi:hypothetical protein
MGGFLLATSLLPAKSLSFYYLAISFILNDRPTEEKWGGM